ncbi:MAG: hypothetical protein FJX23_00525 [Alphaproteobacteria bacterium]|nr:hypothetical protein [Alphaproteobacteria bacterium]
MVFPRSEKRRFSAGFDQQAYDEQIAHLPDGVLYRENPPVCISPEYPCDAWTRIDFTTEDIQLAFWYYTEEKLPKTFRTKAELYQHYLYTQPRSARRKGFESRLIHNESIFVSREWKFRYETCSKLNERARRNGLTLEFCADGC